MKLLLFILGLTLITASPTLRRLQFETDSFSENTEGIFVSANWEEDENVITDDFSWIFENDEPSNEEANLENVALEEENMFPSEEEVLPQEPEDLLTQVRNDPVTSGILDFGVETLIAAGIVKEKIPNVPFTVTSISGLTKTTSNEGDLYDFSCQAVSENGNSVLEMNFTVYYDFHTERRILSSYSYVITTTTTTTTPSQPSQPENEYVQVSDADIESDAVVHSVLEYGVAQILAIGTQAGKIPVSEFAIQDVVSVWKQVTDTGANYKCEVVLENANKATINADFTVAYTSATQQSSLTAYNYTVNIVNVPVTPVDNNNGTTVDGYDVLTGDQISSSAQVQAVLAYGVQQILNSGYASGKIPQSDYDITKIIGVARKTQIKRITYQCEVELQDVKEVLVQARFVVYINTSTEGLSIGSWSYNVSNIRTPNTPVDDTFTYLNETEIADSAEAQSVLAFGVDAILKSGYAKGKIPVSQYNITEIDHVALKHENKRTVYNCKIELQDAKKVKIDAEFTVYVKANQVLDMGSWAYNVTNIRNPTNPTTPTNNTNTTTPTTPTNPTNPTNNTNTTTPTQPTTPVDNSTNTTVDGFVALSNEEIYSVDVLAVLDYGSDQVLASGNAKGKIPVSDYKITRIDSVLKKVEAKRTTYRCDVVMTGTNKAKVDTVFDVYVRNGNYSMGGWSYNVSNIIKPTNPTNTTNTTTPTTPTNNSNTNTTTPTEPTQPTNNTNTTTPTQPTNNTNTTIPTQPTTPVDNSTNTTVDGFVALNNEEIYSADVLDVLDYGTDQVLASGNAKGRIPVSDYKITRIDSVLKKVEARRTTYRCDVVMTGTNKVKVDAVFDVYVRNGNYSMDGWSYNVSNIPVTQTNNTNTNTTKPTTPVNTNNNTNTGNNNTATPTTPTTPTTPVTNTTTNTTAPVVPTTPTTPVVSNNVTDSNFTALTEAQIQAADVQAILTYGGDQVIQRGTASGKIPASTYSINKVNSVAVKTETTRTVYKCNVELLGANKLYVRTEYNVYVKNGTQEKSLGPWGYATAWV